MIVYTKQNKAEIRQEGKRLYHSNSVHKKMTMTIS